MKYAKFIPAFIVLALFSHLSVVIGAAEPSSRRVVYLGTFQKVESATGEHCSGYSIDLWKHDNVLFGLLHHHRGLCGDPPCGVLTDIRHNSETGRIRFKVDTGEMKFYFSGSLKNNSLTGTLTQRWPGTSLDSTETVQLPMRREGYLVEKFHSLEKWHVLYDSIPRCHAVKTYMLDK